MGGFLDVGDYGHNGFKTVVVAAVLILMLCIMSGGRLMSRSLQKAALAADDYILFIATVRPNASPPRLWKLIRTGLQPRSLCAGS